MFSCLLEDGGVYLRTVLELLQSKYMYEHMHVYVYNVVFDCISLVQTFHLSEHNVCGI